MPFPARGPLQPDTAAQREAFAKFQCRFRQEGPYNVKNEDAMSNIMAVSMPFPARGPLQLKMGIRSIQLKKVSMPFPARGPLQQKWKKNLEKNGHGFNAVSGKRALTTVPLQTPCRAGIKNSVLENILPKCPFSWFSNKGHVFVRGFFRI